MKHETEQCGVKTTHRLSTNPLRISMLSHLVAPGDGTCTEERPTGAASQWQIRRAPESEGLDFQSIGVE